MKLQLGERDHNEEVSKCEEGGYRRGEVGKKPRAGGEARVEIGKGSEEHIPERKLDTAGIVEGGNPSPSPKHRYAKEEENRVFEP